MQFARRRRDIALNEKGETMKAKAMAIPSVSIGAQTGFQRWRSAVASDFKMNKTTYLLAVPGILYYIIFCYTPMYGVIIAFKDYTPSLGIFESPWVGLKHLRTFFNSIYFTRLIRNTILLNVYGIVFGFPIPIILALMLNEVRNMKFKKTVQSLTYLPHFISIVVVCGMIVNFTSSTGLITQIVNALGGNYKNMLVVPELYRTIYIASDIWQGAGWGSIIYLAALAGLDMELYEAAAIDGAKKWKQLIHITLPGILPTIIIMLILRVGSVMSLGADKTILLYSPAIYETSDIISSYIYRKGLVENDQSFSTAVGLFNTLINCVLVLTVNYLSNKYTESGLF